MSVASDSQVSERQAFWFQQFTTALQDARDVGFPDRRAHVYAAAFADRVTAYRFAD